jgi:hypothetical protein
VNRQKTPFSFYFNNLSKFFFFSIVLSGGLAYSTPDTCLDPDQHNVDDRFSRGSIQDPSEALPEKSKLICLGDWIDDGIHRHSQSLSVLSKNAKGEFVHGIVEYDCHSIDDGAYGALGCNVREFNIQKKYEACLISYVNESIECSEEIEE